MVSARDTRRLQCSDCILGGVISRFRYVRWPHTFVKGPRDFPRTRSGRRTRDWFFTRKLPLSRFKVVDRFDFIPIRVRVTGNRGWRQLFQAPIGLRGYDRRKDLIGKTTSTRKNEQIYLARLYMRVYRAVVETGLPLARLGAHSYCTVKY